MNSVYRTRRDRETLLFSKIRAHHDHTTSLKHISIHIFHYFFLPLQPFYGMWYIYFKVCDHLSENEQVPHIQLERRVRLQPCLSIAALQLTALSVHLAV